jgi:phosphoribosyl-ATP pyrophosphohydrolase
MPKYKGAYRAELDEERLSYAEEFKKEQEEQAEAVIAQDPDEAAYKKRYGDLRSHSQKLLNQKDQELADIKRQLEDAAKGQIKFPKTDQEVEAWSKKYPEVAAVVDTIARKRANEALEEGEKRLSHLGDLEKKMNKKDAEAQLNRLHPDFSEIRQDPKFHDWVAMQPKVIQDALYKNNTDALSAARAIDLYKVDTGTKTKANNSAAQSVGRAASAKPGTKSKARFSESQISRMTDKEYAKNQEAIMEAMHSGEFEFDMSGATR